MKIRRNDDIEIQVDLEQGSAPIRWRSSEYEPSEWQPTPFQTADAGHRESVALEIVMGWLEANS